MGQNIFLGFCTEVVVRKKNLFLEDAQNIHQAFDDFFGANLYKCHSDSNHYLWTVDPKLLKDGAEIADFMQVQYERVNSRPSENKDDLEKIRKFKSFDQFLDAAKNRKLNYCGVLEDPFDSMPLEQRSLDITTSYLYFYAEGKIYMEGYGDFLQYMTRNLHLANPEFRCSKLARFFIL